MQDVVHHMELFHCLSDPRESRRNFNAECTSESKPEGLTDCRKFTKGP